MKTLKARLKRLLVWSQAYMRTDMLYVARGSFWTALNFVVGSGAAVAMAVVFANLLPKETYGTYKYILSIAGAFSFFSLTGMNAAVARAVARGHDGALPESIRIQLRWNLLYTIALSAVGIYYLAYHAATALGFSLLVLGALSPPAWAFATYSAFLGGKKDFRRGAQYSILGSVVYVGVMLLGILLGRTAAWLIIAYAVGNVLTYALLYTLTIARYKPEGIDTRERREMMSLGKHLSFVNVFSTIALQIDNIAVFKLLGPAELAVYAFAGLMPDRIRNFSKLIVSISTPRLAEKELPVIMKSLPLRLLQSFLIGGLLAAAYIAVAPTVFRLLFPQYEASVLYSQLIALNLLFTVPITYMAFVSHAQNLIPQIYFTSSVSNGARILLVFAGGYFFGVLGIIFGKLAGNALGAVVGFLALRHALKRNAVAVAAPVP